MNFDYLTSVCKKLPPLSVSVGGESMSLDIVLNLID